MSKFIFKVLSLFFLLISGKASIAQSIENKKISGYRPIWFELNQKYEYGDKYSGALGTYTAKHRPLAIYSTVVNKTFFVYGGTKDYDQKHLLCMIGVYDHNSGKVSRPTVVSDKIGVDDPHDNPSLLIDDDGFIWVFVSGRGKKRPGFKYKSLAPYNIEEFIKLTEEEMTYPQPLKTKFGIFNFFTKYSGIRQLYFEKSYNDQVWTDDELLAAIPNQAGEKSGHYQVSSNYKGEKVGTFFNRHPNGIVDKRTDLYYMESSDFGKTWQTVDKKKLSLPVTNLNSPARVVNYSDAKKNIYLKDMVYDKNGNPICLYLVSNGHQPGPNSAPYIWKVTLWNGFEWLTYNITTSDHNYDMGSLWVDENFWRLVAPVGIPPQKWGVGGEIEIWSSIDKGHNWKKEKAITKNSDFNHSYVRKVVDGKAPFVFFWADGDPHEFSKSQLYFGDLKGNVFLLPYSMKDNFEKPEPISFLNIKDKKQ